MLNMGTRNLTSFRIGQRPNAPPISSTRRRRETQEVELMSRPSPPLTPCHSDVEDNDCDSVDQSEIEAGVVGALMSLGGGGTVVLQEEMVGEEDG